MDDMRICGTCHSMVNPARNATECPRCQGPLDPTSEDRLQRFIDLGLIEVNRRGQGTTLYEAQQAAKAVLTELRALREEIDRLNDPVFEPDDSI